MNPQEFDYIRRAVEALEDPEISPMAQRKILRTMEQICGKNATDIELNLIGEVDAKITRNYQDLQNKKLVDILSN
jgi:hypothetical protein